MGAVALSEPAPELSVARGSLILYSSFDVASSADLGECERLLSAHRSRASIEIKRPTHRDHGALELAAAPLHIDLGPLTLDYRSGHGAIRLFDYGTVSFQLTLELEAGQSLAELGRTLDDLVESKELAKLARDQFELLRPKIESALTGEHEWREARSYAVIVVKELSAGAHASQVRSWPGLAKLVACDPEECPMSQEECEDLLQYVDAYRQDDLVVLGSSCALLVEPSGAHEVADIIEHARAQMLQLRFYDAELDAELAYAYRAFDRGGLLRALYSPFGDLARQLSRRLVELTKFTERIDNALKVVADLYLARVYAKAVRRFGINVLKQRVTHKHALVTRIYTMLKDEVSMTRSLTLEVLIVVLIVLEIVLALWGH